MKLSIELKRVFIALLIMAGYMACRYFIYSTFPVRTMADWIRRDTVMDLPRLAGAAAALFMLYRVWGWRGLSFEGFRAALVLGAGLIGTEVVFSLKGSHPFEVPADSLAIFCFSSFVVGLFEEVLFRGALFKAILDWRGRFLAVWLSSFVFAVYHVQAQQFFQWPSSFVFGLIVAQLRLGGVSLFWLILIHGALDCVVGVVGRSASVEMIPLYILVLAALALVQQLSFKVRRPQRADRSMLN